MMRQLFCTIVMILAACGAERPPAAGPANAADGAGPENGGMRMRLAVSPCLRGGKEGYDVRLDLINTSKQPIALTGNWRNEDNGDIEAYLEAATSIECVPEIAPWIGGVAEGQRKLPQPSKVVAAGETLSLSWETQGRHLKNRVTNPNDVQDPTFKYDGLYSVHATLDVITDKGTVRLRSNEQLVSAGGSMAMPKYTHGPLWTVDREKKTALLGLGSLHKVEVGDEFEIGSPKGKHWKLTITQVQEKMSIGKLELLTRSKYEPYNEPPEAMTMAKFVGRGKK
jgi:hypothetical protein